MDSIDDYFEPVISESAGMKSRVDEEEENDFITNIEDTQPDFDVYLTEQIEFLNPERELKPAIEILISHLDDRGYLSSPIDELIEAEHIGIHVEHWPKALKFIQDKLEPPGLGATNLQECFLLQVERLGDDFALEKSILTDHFDDLLHNRLAQIGKNMDVPIEKIVDAVDFFKDLSMRPASPFQKEENATLKPDAYVKFDPPDTLNQKGKFIIELSQQGSPQLEVIPGSVYKKEQLSKKERKYLSHQMNSGKALVEAIRRRNETLFLVIQSICQRQIAFFEEGKGGLKPLLMQDISKDMDMSAATITRTVKDKVIQTDYGLFPLKYFFSLKNVKMSGGEVNQRDDILNALKEIIDTENKKKPLSDANISKKLAEKNFKVAVRTVSKYRDMLDLPSSSKRKQF
ncbi:MAG: RNA polymerase factor sigma-54 [Planctomycetes bacterium]|nr:RNA polymerase factor sigma-54 [Planctomycetota bacterium]